MDRIDPWRDWRRLGPLALLAAFALWIGWVGFIASDDSLYYAGADRWLVAPPSPGQDHWTTRFPLTLTFAGVLAVLGRNFAAFAVTAILFYALLIAVVGWATMRIAGARAGWIAALLTATLPVVVSHATTVSVDLIEASALLAGAMLLGAGTRARGLAAGLCFGAAILCRETSALALFGLVPLFLLGRPVGRDVLIACGLGVAAVLGGEALFQYALTGDALRRYPIAFNHDSRIDRAANMEGNLLLWPPIDPLLVLLVNDDFALLFWLAGAALAAGAARGLAADARRRLIVLAAMAGGSFVLVAALYTKLVLNPRYFMLPALAAVIVVAIWLDRAAPRLRIAVLAAAIGANLLMLGVGNAHPRWRMEALVDAAARHPRESVAGEPSDVRRADIPMAFLGQANLRYAPAPPGGLAIEEAGHADGTIVAHYPSPPTRIGAIVRAAGAERFVPAPISRRLFAPSPPVVLVRTPRSTPGG